MWSSTKRRRQHAKTKQLQLKPEQSKLPAKHRELADRIMMLKPWQNLNWIGKFGPTVHNKYYERLTNGKYSTIRSDRVTKLQSA